MNETVSTPEPGRENFPTVEPGGGWISGPMTSPPTPAHRAAPVDPPDEFEGSPIVGLAVHELAVFGGGLSRTTARMLLGHWKYRHELSWREFHAVLRRFPESGEGA